MSCIQTMRATVATKGPFLGPQTANHSQAKPRWTPGWKAKLVICLMSVVGTLLALELGVRVFFAEQAEWTTRPFEPLFVSGDYYGAMPLAELAKTREGPRASGYRPTTGMYLHDRPRDGWDAHWRADFLFDHYLSRHSARDADRLGALEPRPIRIFVIGGSLAVGSSATSKEKTWHALLEKALRERFGREDIHVINAAMGAFVSTQERIALEFAVAPREPDMVIALNGYNDIHTPISVGVAPGDPLQTGMRYAELYDTSFGRWICGQSALARWLWKAKAHARMIAYQNKILDDPATSQQILQGIAQVYCGNAQWILKRCAQMGCPGIVFFQDWRERGDCDPSLSKMAKFALDTTREIERRMSKADRKEDFLDLGKLHEALARHYTDEVHVDDPGQEILAQAMLEPVARKLAGRLSRTAAGR